MVSEANVIGGIHQAMFDKDISSLGTKPDLGKISSPGLNMAVQSLLIGKSSLIGGEAWFPALVESLMIAGSNSTGSSSVQQIIAPVLISGFPNTTPSLNMVEISAQALITSFHYIQSYLLRYSGSMMVRTSWNRLLQSNWS